MRVLVTGGAGYLGGRISAYLACLPGMNVLIGTSRPAGKALIPGAEYIFCDMLAEESVSAACAGVDAVVHLAALNEIDSLADPQRALRVTTGGTISLVKAARPAGVKRIIYFSTAHVYGAPLAGHITEDTLPCPTHPYAITHRAAEDFILAAHSRNLDGIVLRLSNAIGAPHNPGVNRWTLLVNDLCRQAVTTKQMILRSAGTQFRDFICMADVSRTVEHFLRLDRERTSTPLFNVGSGTSLRILEMTDLIADRCRVVLGFQPEIVRAVEAGSEPSRPLTYSCDKLRGTGFEFQGKIEAEIDETLRLCSSAFSR